MPCETARRIKIIAKLAKLAQKSQERLEKIGKELYRMAKAGSKGIIV